MVLPVSPNPISMNDVNVELGITSGTPITLNDYRVRLLAKTPTGSVGMDALRGKQVPTLVQSDVGDPGSSTSSNITYNGLSIGTADSTRVVIVAVAGVSGTGGRPINSVTLNGTAMNEVVSVYTSNGFTVSSAIYYLAVPTGTTANFIVYTGGNQSPVPYILAAYGLNNAAPYAIGSATSPGTNATLSQTLNLEPDGLVIAIGSTRETGGGTFSGITDRLGTTRKLAYDTKTAQASRTISFDDNSSWGSFCVAAWR